VKRELPTDPPAQAPAEAPTRPESVWDQAPGPAPGSRWKPRFVFAAKSFLNVALVATLTIGALRLTEKAREAPRHQVDLDRWTVLARPSWSRLPDVEDLRKRAGLPRHPVSILDREELGRVRDALESCPLVLRVHALRRRLPGRVEIVAELRIPAAAIEIEGEPTLYVEVDRAGTSLGEALAERPWRRGRPLRVVRGTAGPSPPAGQRFGPDARAGADLCARLDEAFPALSGVADTFLDVVDVSNLGGRLGRTRPEVTLLSLDREHGPCRVIWGRVGAVAEENGEPDFEAKFGRLREALRLFPRLSGLESVNVAFEELTLVPVALPSGTNEDPVGERTGRSVGALRE